MTLTREYSWPLLPCTPSSGTLMGTALQGPLLSRPARPTGSAYPTQGPHPEILNNVGHQRPPRPSQQDQSSQPCVPGECPGPGECVGGSCRKTPWKTANVTNSWAHVRQARGSCTRGLAHNLQPRWMLRPGARAEPARSPTPESRVLLRGRIGRGQEPGS